MEKQEELITWDERFILGIPIIDRQREKLFEMINNLNIAIIEADVLENYNFEDSVQGIINYMNYHFNTEERLMLLLDYYDTFQHREKHYFFMEEVIMHSKTAFGENRIDLCHFLNYLKNEGFSHFAIYDREFAHYYLKMRESGRLKTQFKKNPELTIASA